MKRFGSLGLSAVLFLGLQSQPTFEKIILSTGSSKLNLIELGSHNLLVAMAWYPGISLMSPEGDIIQSKCFWGDSVLTMSSIRRYTDNEFYFVTGYRKDSCTVVGTPAILNTHPVIGRMDSLGNVLAFRHYVLNAPSCYNMPGDLEVTSDKEVITWGRDNRFFALKVDSAGDPLWAKYFLNHGGFRFIKELPGGDLLAGINMDTAGVVVARLDAEGNFLWCNSYMRPKGVVHDCLIESDNSYIITGYTDSIASTNVFVPLPLDYHPKLFMMRLDGSGEVQWCKGYNSEPRWYTRHGLRIVRAQDDSYVVLANVGVQDYNRSLRPFLMKTDQNGDTVWTRSVGVNGYRYDTSDLLAYSDGGFLFDGVVNGNLPGGWLGAPYIFKIDSLGHLPCSEQWHPIEVLDLFPADSSFTLTSVDGAMMQPAFVSDTIFDPLTVYDGCIITSVMDPMATRKTFKVYPNPNTGRFTVEFADPLMAESYYSVYDALGKLLYQRPLPTGATLEELDLSRYGRGTYAIKFTSPAGVCYERVVLE